MISMSNNSFEIRLKNAEGVPILQLGGNVTKTALTAVKSTMDRLASAGHYNIVLNLERADVTSWDFLSELTESIQRIKDHYGAVDLVATQDRIQQILRIEQVADLFRFCRSESQAIAHIKKLYRQPDSIRDTNARLLESS